jgi:hypothetical protein
MSGREAHAQLRAYFKANPSDTSGEWWLAADAMNFREAIAGQLAGGGRPLTDADRGVLGRWLKALDDSTWKRIADKLDCHFWIVAAALNSKHAAELDAEAGENHKLVLARQYLNAEVLETLAASAEAMLRFYDGLTTRRAGSPIASSFPSTTSGRNQRSFAPRSRLWSTSARSTGRVPTRGHRNPHLSLRVSWGGDVKLDVKASNPTWSKWLPCWPTSPHWYDESRFRRYMAAHIANREKTTVREFVSEFRGLSSTVKQKAILAEIGASHVSLYDFFGRCKANGENIAKLLAALKEHSKPVHPRQLGVIGKDHFYRLMESAGGDPKTFTYNRAFDETDDGVPYVSEFAFGVHRDGLIAGRGPRRKEITGVNWSPGIKNPFRELGRGGSGMDTTLSEVRANISQPVMVALHLACPRVAYTDRGKSAIVVEGKAAGNDHDEA